MKKTIFIICHIVTVCLCFSLVRAGAEHADFEKNFAMPPAQFGSAPFWSWNETLDPEELKFQLDEFADKGMGGFFIHAREGLITEYMGPDWMQAVRLSVDRAKDKGLIAYLYDEDRWPSGYASGKVPAMNADFQQKALVFVKSEIPLTQQEMDTQGQLLRIFLVELDGVRLVSYSDVTQSPSPAPQGKTLVYFFQGIAEPEEWFNSQTYIDTLNPDAVDAFIQVTHEEYKKVIGSEFGKTVPAIFTDEPEFVARRHFSSEVAPWTGRLPGTFLQNHGYDIMDKLPLIFFDGGSETAGVRLDFWTTATEMFRDAFAKRIFEWGEKNNIQLTGHYMLEDTLMDQIWRIGAAMPHYEYMQFPGMDHLGRNIDNLLTAKQVSSVAHQFSRPLILTELYGCSGWNLSFENMKWMADWHYALGVNFMNQHLSWYSMRGERKRDYPTTIQYQSPWWKDYRTVADYLRRATYATASGKFVAETLVLHPISSGWAAYSPIGTQDVVVLHKAFNSLIYGLSGRQVDYDLGDEIIISRHGAVRDGKFVVKDMAYTVVVIPDMKVMRASTLALLKDFLTAGGTVVALGGNHYLADGRDASTLDGSIVAGDIDDVVRKIEPALKRRVRVVSDQGTPAPDTLYLHQRDIEGRTFLFFANTDPAQGTDVVAHVPQKGRVRAWDLFDGAVRDVAFTSEASGVAVPLHFEPAGSILLSVSPDEAPAAAAPKFTSLVREQPLSGDWKIVDRSPNALTVDMVSYQREGDSAWINKVPYHVAQDSMESQGDGLTFRVKYRFGIGVEPDAFKDIFMVMEQPGDKEIFMNGAPVKYTDAGWWIDESFKKIDVRDKLIKGKNELEVRGVFHGVRKPGTKVYLPGGTEIESIYVVGDFSVASNKNSKFMIVPASDGFSYGDLVEKGYPFFAGSLAIERTVDVAAPQPGERVFLAIDGFDAITDRVHVNGSDAGLIAFHPHRIDITDFLKSGSNRIRVELTNSNRNLLGPHHAVEREPLSVGPGTFKSDILTNHYYFIPFGVSRGMSLQVYQ